MRTPERHLAEAPYFACDSCNSSPEYPCNRSRRKSAIAAIRAAQAEAFAAGQAAEKAKRDSAYAERNQCVALMAKLAVVVTLGNGEHIGTPCDYCGKGWGGPRGFTVEWTPWPAVRRVTVDGKRIEERDGKREIHYSAAGHGFDDGDLFEREEDAMARAHEKVAAWEEDRRLGVRHTKNGVIRGASWAVGYHRRAAAEAAKQVEYHGRMAALAKVEAKAIATAVADPGAAKEEG
jgi:hypothetical protein